MAKLRVLKVVREVRAWDLGADDWMSEQNERARVKGGHALYESVWSSAARCGRDVRLGRVDSTPDGLKPVARWVDGDTTLEVVQVAKEA